MTTPAIPNFTGPNRVDFRVGLWEKLINDKGYNIKVDSSALCPCIDQSTKRPVPNCSNCRGNGTYYWQTVTTQGIITRQNNELDLGNSIGVAAPGEAFLTVLQPSMLSVFDRITNLDSIIVYSEGVTHNSTGDFLRFPPVNSIENAVTQPTRTGSLVTLIQGTDYTVDSTTGEITWLSTANANSIAVEQMVSFRYWYHPTWIVQDTLNSVRDTNVIDGQPTNAWYAMPTRVRMKLETQII